MIIDNSDTEKLSFTLDIVSVDADMPAKIKRICGEKLEATGLDIHFDLSKVKYFDSASIGALMYIIQISKKKGCKVYIDQITDKLKELFASLLLDQFLIYNK